MGLPDPEDMPDEVGGNPRVRPHTKIDSDEYADLSNYGTDSTTDDTNDDELATENRGDDGDSDPSECNRR